MGEQRFVASFSSHQHMLDIPDDVQSASLDLVWSGLRTTLGLLMHRHEDVEASTWSRQYADVGRLCSAPHPEGTINTVCLYRKVKGFLESHATELYVTITSRCASPHHHRHGSNSSSGAGERELLVAYCKQWKAYRTGTYYIHWLLYSLNAHIVKMRNLASGAYRYDNPQSYNNLQQVFPYRPPVPPHQVEMYQAAQPFHQYPQPFQPNPIQFPVPMQYRQYPGGREYPLRQYQSPQYFTRGPVPMNALVPVYQARPLVPVALPQRVPSLEQVNGFSSLHHPYGEYAIVPYTNHERSPWLHIDYLALKIWKNEVLLPLRHRLSRGILDEIVLHRSVGASSFARFCYDVNFSLLHLETNLIHDSIELYKFFIENAHLEETEHHFRNLANQLLCKAQGNAAKYVKLVLMELEAEKDRLVAFFPARSHACTMEIVYDCLISSQLQFLYGQCEELIKEGAAFDLNRVYQVLNKCDGVGPLLEILENHVSLKAKGIVQKVVDANLQLETVMKEIHDMHKKYSKLVSQAFGDNIWFSAALKNSIVPAVDKLTSSHSNPTFPTLFAEFCHALLTSKTRQIKADNRKYTEQLEQVSCVFCYLQEDDQIEYIHRCEKQLAQRLLANMSDICVEKQFVEKLHKILPCKTFKLRGMLEDVNGKDPNLLRPYVDTKIDISVRLLRTALWPLTLHKMAFNVPLILRPAMKQCEVIYRRKFPDRKIVFQHEVSSVEVELTYLSVRYQVTMSVWQLSVLLLFDEQDEVTVRSITDATQVPTDRMEHILESLITSGLLLKESSTSVRLNRSFAHDTRSVILPQTDFTVAEEQPRWTPTGPDTSVEDRKGYLQCLVMRIVKVSGPMDHDTLVREIREQANFEASPDLIQQTVKFLLDRDFLFCVPGKADVYSYDELI